MEARAYYFEGEVLSENDASWSEGAQLRSSAEPCRSPSRRCRRVATAAGATASLLLASLAVVGWSSSLTGGGLRGTPRGSQFEVKVEDAAGGAASAYPTVAKEAAKPPHIIFVLIDDLGFNDFKDSQDLSNSWPFVKSIANESIFVNTTYTEAWCSPSRASFLTGRYNHLLGKNSFSSKDETTIAQKLNAVGYMSYAIGKWHVGWETWSMTPMGRGFHRYLGNLMNPADHYTHCSRADHRDPKNIFFDQSYMESYPFLDNSSSPSQPFFDVAEGTEGKYDAQVFDKVAELFLKQHKAKFPEKPFFLYYAMYADHHPYQASDEWKVSCQNVVSQGRRNLCGMQRAADSALKNLTALLQTEYADDRYVLVLTGDNGGMIGRGRSATGWSNNYPLRGMKFTDWEGGVHSRAMIHGKHPDLAASSMRGKMYTGGFMHLVDWHATLAELGGASLDSGRFPASGTSVWRALLNNEPSPRQQIAIRSGETGVSYFREGDWVLMTLRRSNALEATVQAPPVYPVPQTDYKDNITEFLEYKARHPMEAVKLPALFNIWKDISEEDPLYTSKLADMTTSLEKWLAQSGRVSTAHDLDCPNAACAAERETARENVTRSVASGLTGPCAGQALYPYWDVPTCSCSLED